MAGGHGKHNNAHTPLAPPTSLAAAARTLSLRLRWLLVLLAPLLYLVDPVQSPAALVVASVALVFNLVLTWRERVHRHPSLLAVAPFDCLLIGAGLVARGPMSD